MPRDISKFLSDVSVWANQDPRQQVSTLAHVLLYSLGQNVQKSTPAVQEATSELEANLKSYASMNDEHKKSQKTSRRIISDYSFDEVKASYARFYQQRQEHSTLPDSVLWWALEGDLDNKWLVLGRKICTKHQVDALSLFSESSNTQVHELGFGVDIRSDSLVGSLLGREADLSDILASCLWPLNNADTIF